MSAPAASAQEDARSAAKEKMIATAAQLASASTALSAIWPGYWPTEQAFIIHLEGEGALLVSPGPRPDGFEPVSDAAVPASLKGRAFFHRGTLPGAARPFVPAFPIGEGRTAMLVNAAGADPQSIINLIVHEQFHDHQNGAFRHRAVNQFVHPQAVKDRVAFAAAAEVERRVLSAALTARSDAERRQLLRSYFALRREREASVPAEVVAVEQGYERLEGTAKYVDRAAHAKIFAGGDHAHSALLAQELDRPIDLRGPFRTVWFRSRSYGTGAALTYLISQYDKEEWHSKIAAGAKLDVLLASLISMPSPPEAARLALLARERFNYEARRRELEPAIRDSEKAEIKSVDEFLALAPFRFVLDGAADGGKLQPGFSARSMTELSPSTLALPITNVFSLSGSSFTLTARQRPVLIQSQEKRYSILLSAAPLIEGKALQRGKHKLSGIRIEDEGVELTVERPVLVTVGDKIMTVELLKES